MSTLKHRLIELEKLAAGNVHIIAGLTEAYEVWEAAATVGGIQPLLARLEAGTATEQDQAILAGLSPSPLTPNDRLQGIAELEQQAWPSS